MCDSFSLRKKVKSNGCIEIHFILYTKIEERDLETATDAFDRCISCVTSPLVFCVIHSPDVEKDIDPPDINTFMWIVRFITGNSSVVDRNLKGICVLARKVDDIAKIACNTFNFLNPKRDDWVVEITDDLEDARSIVRNMFKQVT